MSTTNTTNMDDAQTTIMSSAPISAISKAFHNFEYFMSQEMLFGLSFAIILIQAVINYAADLKNHLIKPLIQLLIGTANSKSLIMDVEELAISTVIFFLVILIVWIFISAFQIKYPSLSKLGTSYS